MWNLYNLFSKLDQLSFYTQKCICYKVINNNTFFEIWIIKLNSDCNKKSCVNRTPDRSDAFRLGERLRDGSMRRGVARPTSWRNQELPLPALRSALICSVPRGLRLDQHSHAPNRRRTCTVFIWPSTSILSSAQNLSTILVHAPLPYIVTVKDLCYLYEYIQFIQNCTVSVNKSTWLQSYKYCTVLYVQMLVWMTQLLLLTCLLFETCSCIGSLSGIGSARTFAKNSMTRKRIREKRAFLKLPATRTRSHQRTLRRHKLLVKSSRPMRREKQQE